MGSAHADYLSLEDLIKNNNIIEFNKLLNEEYKTTDLSEEIQYNYLKLHNIFCPKFAILELALY